MSFAKQGEEIKGSSPYTQYDFKEVGTKLTFLMVGQGTRNSAEWGEFKVAEVVSFNPEAKSIEDAVASAKLNSFVLFKVLENQVANGLIVPGECYSIEMVLEKGDKYINQKTNKQEKAKANHFKVMRLEVPQEGIDALYGLVPNKMVQASTTVAQPTSAEEPKDLPRV